MCQISNNINFMRQSFIKHTLHILAILGVFSMVRCTEKWDEHYNVDPSNESDQTITDFINSRSDLSEFANLLMSTGYDSILNTSQSYTVWAPVNGSFEGLDLSNDELVMSTIKNHITRGKVTTSFPGDHPVYMLNGKYVNFVNSGNEFVLGHSMVSEVNNLTTNGLVHIADSYEPYTYNIWEYIDNTPGLESLKEYVHSKDTMIFDPVNSVEIGRDTAGVPIFDSINIYGNELLTELGSLNVEDSVYTVLLPDNTAWTEAYDRISGFFNFPENAGGAARKEDVSKKTIIQDMVFRGKIENYTGLDSLVSTYGNKFYDPAYLFQGKQGTELSNGMAYVTDQMPFIDTTSWYKEIRVEAEWTEGREDANCDISIQTSLGSGLDISNKRYILAGATGTSDFSTSSVTFSIPNTLSAKYNIYCVFVPHSIVDKDNLKSSQVSYRLTYINTSTGRTRGINITPEFNITDPQSVTKMFVDQVDFGYANIVDEDYENVVVKLLVKNEVKVADENAEGSNLTRDMRIDCIIFEPVVE